MKQGRKKREKPSVSRLFAALRAVWRPRPQEGVSALFLGVALLLALLLAGCGRQDAASTSQPSLVGGSTKRGAVYSQQLQFAPPAATDVFVTVKTDKGDVRFVLYPQYAPLAVENFCTLASQGYYDGTAFHRVVADFLVQGGDATGTGRTGSSAWGVPFGVERSAFLHHYSGALCMAAGQGEGNTNLSQFYIVATPQNALDEAALAALLAAGVRQEVVEAYGQAGGAPYLDNTDTVFGQVVEGMDIVDRIASAAVGEDGTTPAVPAVVEGVIVENYTPLYSKGRPAYTPPVLQPVPTEIAEDELPQSDA